MKNLLIIFLGFVLFYGCENNKVEIIPDYDYDYPGAEILDVTPEITEEMSETTQNEVLKIIEAHQRPDSQRIFYSFDVILFIDQSGKLDKIQFKKIEPKESIRKKYPVINPNLESLYSSLADYLQSLKYKPGELGGEKIKSQLKWEFTFGVELNGNAEFMLVDLDFGDFFNTKETAFPDDVYFVAVEEMPMPIGGIKAIADNVVYPELAKRTAIEGRVFVKAFINEEGIVDRTEIIKGIGSGCDEAAERAVKSVKFIPGKQRGKTVKVQVSIPILFKLK